MKFQVDPRVLPLLLKIPHWDRHQLCLPLHETIVAQMYPLPLHLVSSVSGTTIVFICSSAIGHSSSKQNNSKSGM